MNNAQNHAISVRAIEDIIQIQKLIEESPNLKSVKIGKNQSEERVFFSILKHDVYSPDSANNRLSGILKKCEIENSFKCNDKNCKRLDMNCWERDCGFTKFVNPEVVVLENFGIIENTSSDTDVKCWSSDSDITILRVKKEFRNELSNKVEWEEQRNLEDDVSLSSTNLDWESHSLINLAGVSSTEKDVSEGLKPFTIWSKAKSDTRNSSMVFMENLNSITPFELGTPEVKVTVENNEGIPKKEIKKFRLPKKKGVRKFLSSAFSCFMKKKSFH